MTADARLEHRMLAWVALTSVTMLGIAVIHSWAQMIAGPCRGYDQRRQVSDLTLKRLSGVVSDYRARFGALPRSAAELDWFLGWRPIDPWGNPYVYSWEGGRYRIESLGADGSVGGDGEDADVGTEYNERY